MKNILFISLLALNIDISFSDVINQGYIQSLSSDTTKVVFSDSLFKAYINLFEKVINKEFVDKDYPLNEIQKGIMYISIITEIESETPRSCFLGGKHFVSKRDVIKWKDWYNKNIREFYSIPNESKK